MDQPNAKRLKSDPAAHVDLPPCAPSLHLNQDELKQIVSLHNRKHDDLDEAEGLLALSRSDLAPAAMRIVEAPHGRAFRGIVGLLAPVADTFHIIDGTRRVARPVSHPDWIMVRIGR